MREQFKRIKPLRDIAIKERGWTLDVLNLVRRLVEARGVHAASTSQPQPTPKRPEGRAPNGFTNEDVYAFNRGLEKLHPDNRSLRTATR